MNTKKQTAIQFLELVSKGDVEPAYNNFVHSGLIHHNIYFKGDATSLKQAMKENAEQFPEKKYETLRALEDGDLVTVHGKVSFGGKVYGLIHIFRFDGDKIMEMWEASQEELKDSPNENGLF